VNHDAARWGDAAPARPCLVVLHGANASPADVRAHLDDELAALAAAHDVTIVAPDGDDGWWLDGSAGRHQGALVELLAPVLGPIGVTGYSMGGHGALALALSGRLGPRLRAVSSISGALDLTLARDRAGLIAQLGAYEAAPAAWVRASVLHQVQAGARAPRVALRLACGKGDRWAATNLALHHALSAAAITHEFHDHDGAHDWAYWRPRLLDDLAWLLARVSPTT
jgi:hypothetical protein